MTTCAIVEKILGALTHRAFIALANTHATSRRRELYASRIDRLHPDLGGSTADPLRTSTLRTHQPIDGVAMVPSRRGHQERPREARRRETRELLVHVSGVARRVLRQARQVLYRGTATRADQKAQPLAKVACGTCRRRTREDGRVINSPPEKALRRTRYSVIREAMMGTGN
jgi:hypothetical protein